jgi:hypothetical protein
VELTLTAPGDRPAPGGLTAADLRAVRLDQLARTCYTYAGTYVPHGDGGWMRLIGPAAGARDRQRMAQAARRRAINDDFLDRVRQLYAETTGSAGQRVEAVAEALYVSKRQAARYVARAGV